MVRDPAIMLYVYIFICIWIVQIKIYQYILLTVDVYVIYTHTEPYFISLCFTDTAISTNWRFVTTLCQAGLSASFFQQHLFSSCLCVTFWQFLQYFKTIHYYYIWYGDLWSETFDVTIVNVLGHQEARPCKTANLVDKCVCLLTAPPIGCSPSLSPLRPPYPLGNNSVEIRPTNNPTNTSKCLSERKIHMSLTLNQKLEMTKLRGRHVQS